MIGKPRNQVLSKRWYDQSDDKLMMSLEMPWIDVSGPGLYSLRQVRAAVVELKALTLVRNRIVRVIEYAYTVLWLF